MSGAFSLSVVNGGWSTWSAVIDCSPSNPVNSIRTRTCTNPEPSPLGDPCPGSDTDIVGLCPEGERNIFAFGCEINMIPFHVKLSMGDGQVGPQIMMSLDAINQEPAPIQLPAPLA